jgi:hypothetical protein
VVVERAKGRLAGQGGTSPDDAFVVLHRHALQSQAAVPSSTRCQREDAVRASTVSGY